MSDTEGRKVWLLGVQALKWALVAFHGERWDFGWTLYVYNGDEGFEAGLPAPERYNRRFHQEVEECWQRIRDAVREGALPVIDCRAREVRVEPREALRLRYALAHSHLGFFQHDFERWLASFVARKTTWKGEVEAERWLMSLVRQHPEGPPNGWRRDEVLAELAKSFPISKRGAERVWQRVTQGTKWQQAGRPRRKSPARKSPARH